MTKAFVCGILICLLWIFGIYASVKSPTRIALYSISPEDIRRHINFLASDSLKGRDTPSPGLDISAEYIADQFNSYGLQPINGSYYQKFNLNLVRLGEDNFLKLKDTSGAEISFQIKKDFMPFEFTANQEVKSELVFAGYGITAPELNYDDYQNIEVHDKIVLVLRHEPGEKDSMSVFNGIKSTQYSSVRAKVKNAIDHGAAGLLVVTDPLNHRSLRPRGFPWPSLYKNIPNEAIPYTLARAEGKKIPVVQVGKKFIAEIFGSVDSLKSIQKDLDSSMTPKSFLISDFVVSLKTTTSVESKSTQNVVGLWEGSDSKLKDEFVVVGAHYDHVGIKKGEIKPGEDYIYNGADDNASGTVGVLEIAEAFTIAPRPKRSIIFVAFAGEEKGLFGSRACVEQPLWSLSKTKAMFNMDMLGRNEGDRVTIIGFSHYPELNQINTEENKFVGLRLEYNGEKYFNRSDHYSFARKGIPVLFYTTGEHADYHKVTDSPDKVNEGKIAMIARLVFRTVWHAANTNKSLN